MKTIYYGGAVYTGDLPLVEAFVVEDGKFVFAGSNEEALGFEGEKVDLAQQALMLTQSPSRQARIPRYWRTSSSVRFGSAQVNRIWSGRYARPLICVVSWRQAQTTTSVSIAQAVSHLQPLRTRFQSRRVTKPSGAFAMLIR